MLFVLTDAKGERHYALSHVLKWEKKQISLKYKGVYIYIKNAAKILVKKKKENNVKFLNYSICSVWRLQKSSLSYSINLRNTQADIPYLFF